MSFLPCLLLVGHKNLRVNQNECRRPMLRVAVAVAHFYCLENDPTLISNKLL